MTMTSSSSDEEGKEQFRFCKETKFSYFGPRLVPFLKTACIYLILVPEIQPPTVVVAVLKCLPTFTLCIFVLWYDGFSFTNTRSYSKCVLGGLVASMLGDAFLVYADDGYFLHGMAAFGLAHISYICAFGFKPLRPAIYLKLLPPTLLLYFYLSSKITNLVLKVAVLIYSFLIMVMNWRALARIRNLQAVRDGVNGTSHKRWTELVACLGAISFMISDTCLAINRFSYAVPYERWIVMSTYYLAQLGIALSVVKSHYNKDKKSSGAGDEKMVNAGGVRKRAVAAAN